MAEQGGAPIEEMSPAEGRELYRMMRPVTDAIAVDNIENRTIPGPAGDIPIRIYHPNGDAARGVYVNFHGGGWVIGDLDTSDGVCRGICVTADVIVVSVDYRLAPEHPYPAAVDDSWAATQWVASNMSALNGNGKIAVGGESAGGNLAAVAARKATELSAPNIALQFLQYPVVDHSLERQSYEDNGEGYILTTNTMRWFWDHYCPSLDSRNDTEASPLLATSFANLPPALIITAEFDPLRDEGEAYAQALTQAGVKADHRCIDGVVHDFFATAGLFEACTNAFNDACATLKEALED